MPLDGLWTMKSKSVGLIVSAISFQDSSLCDPDVPTLQMDGWLTCNCKSMLYTTLQV